MELQCQNKDHANQLMQYICIFEQCSSPNPCCQLCVTQLHGTHTDSCVHYLKLGDLVKDKYLEKMNKTMEGYQMAMQKLIINIQSSLMKKQAQSKQLSVQFTPMINQLQKLLSLQQQIDLLAAETDNIIMNSQKLNNEAQNSQSFKQDSLLSVEKLQIQEVINEQKSIIQLEKNVQKQGNQPQVYESNLEEYNKILQDLSKKNEMFYDKDFPPNANSIGFDYQGQAWERASSFCQGQMKFFCEKDGLNVFGSNGKVSECDIIQGTVGNDNLYGIIYLLANHCPKVLEDNFISKDVNKSGVYAIRLYLQGQEKIIIVDDLLPYNGDYQLHIKLLGKDYSIWIAILEKALAKLFGSYRFYDNQNLCGLVQSIINAPDLIFATEQEELLTIIASELNHKNFILTGHSKAAQEYNGFDARNFYQIVGIKKCHHPSLLDVQLIEIKCPWGGRQWKGNWGCYSELVTEELRKELNYDKEDDGIFYMDQFSFMQCFNAIHSFQVGLNKVTTNMMSCRKKHAVYCKLQIIQAGTYAFILKNMEKRDAHVFNKVLIVKMKQNNEFEYQYDGIKAHISDPHRVYLSAGTFIIYTKVYWDHSEKEDIKLQIYGCDKVQINEIQKIPNFLHLAFQSFVLKQGEITLQRPNSPIICRKHQFAGWLVLLVQNETQNQVPANFDFPTLSNAKLCKPLSGNTASLSFAPNSITTVIVQLNQNANVIYVLK